MRTIKLRLGTGMLFSDENGTEIIDVGQYDSDDDTTLKISQLSYIVCADAVWAIY